jgi:hypothetical protein
MECGEAAAVSAEVVNVALPALTVPVPIVVPPSLKATVPLGVPPKVVVTFAVKVTDWPNVEGFNDELRNVAVGPLPTVKLSGTEVAGG